MFPLGFGLEMTLFPHWDMLPSIQGSIYMLFQELYYGLLSLVEQLYGLQLEVCGVGLQGKKVGDKGELCLKVIISHILQIISSTN